jgi:hypothetical protein
MFKRDEEKKEKWFQQRWAKLTASENYKLLTNDKKGNCFGATAWDYIEEKAMQMCTVMWEKPSLDGVESILHGGMYEYPAYQEYVRVTGLTNMIYLGTENPLFLDDEELLGESGGSPDVIMMNNDLQIIRGAELKCPKNPMNHFKRLKWTSQWDVKENYIQAYTQIQNLLKISKAPEWDFVSFDERMKNPALKIKVITCYPDKKFQDNLHLRTIKAVEEKYKIIKQYEAA